MKMFRLFLTLICLGTMGASQAAEPALSAYDQSILVARDAEVKGLLGKALKELETAEKLDPKRLEAYFLRARIYSLQRKRAESVASLTKVLEIDPKLAVGYNLRGMELFKLGKLEQAVADFDKYLELEPKETPEHWQRGIALYLLGKYEAGKKQFEAHQTVNSEDVENAVFHFICVARADNFEKARAGLIQIHDDRRVPMMEVFNLFAGKGTEQDVMNALQRGNPSPAALESRSFFAHYYIGLYWEAKGEPKKAYDHFRLAATDFAQDHYMGDVAKVHFERLLK